MAMDSTNPRSPHFRPSARTGQYIQELGGRSERDEAGDELLIDRASAARKISDDELASWADQQAAFISSVMSELGPERQAVAGVLEDIGIRPVWFEEFGGRDDDPEEAYRHEVRRSAIYIGLIGELYGKRLRSGFSATHEEYEEAVAGGKRLSVWVKEPAPDRDGHAERFLQDVRTFHTTGRFSTPADLGERVRERLREMAGEDLAPWVKLGDAIFRADEIRHAGRDVTITATVRDRDIQHFLDELDPAGGWGSSRQRVTFFDTAVEAEIAAKEFTARSAGLRTYTLVLQLHEVQGGGMRSGMSGRSPDDLVEAGVKAGLLGAPLDDLGDFGWLGETIPSADPLARLDGARLPESSVQAVARLLLVEAYVGPGQVGRIRDFRLGPSHQGERAVTLEWAEPRDYANQAPGTRRVEGRRRGP
jgi:hypothetical protein